MLHIIIRWSVLLYAVTKVEGDFRYLGPPSQILQMKDKLTTKIPTELEFVYVFIHEMNIYKQYMKQFNSHTTLYI